MGVAKGQRIGGVFFAQPLLLSLRDGKRVQVSRHGSEGVIVLCVSRGPATGKGHAQDKKKEGLPVGLGNAGCRPVKIDDHGICGTRSSPLRIQSLRGDGCPPEDSSPPHTETWFPHPCWCCGIARKNVYSLSGPPQKRETKPNSVISQPPASSHIIPSHQVATHTKKTSTTTATTSISLHKLPEEGEGCIAHQSRTSTQCRSSTDT